MSLKEKLTELARNEAENNEAENLLNFWANQVNELYNEIRNWFHDYSNEGYINFGLAKEMIDEEPYPYEIDRLELDIKGGPSVILEPVGANIIGAWGRIDVYLNGYVENKVMLLLMKDDSGKPYWELRKSRKREDRFVFDKKIFENLLEDWLDNPPDFI